MLKINELKAKHKEEEDIIKKKVKSEGMSRVRSNLSKRNSRAHTPGRQGSGLEPPSLKTTTSFKLSTDSAVRPPL